MPWRLFDGKRQRPRAATASRSGNPVAVFLCNALEVPDESRATRTCDARHTRGNNAPSINPRSAMKPSIDNHSPWLPHSGCSVTDSPKNAAAATAIVTSSSRVRVAPMNTPSNWKPHTDTIGSSAAHTK